MKSATGTPLSPPRQPPSPSPTPLTARSAALKRPASPSSESSASKRALSEDPASTPDAGGPPASPTPSDTADLSVDTDRALHLTPSRPRASGHTTPTRAMSTSPLPHPPSPEDQLCLVDAETAHAPLVKGDVWHLIARSWYQRWRSACRAASGTVADEGSAKSEAVEPACAVQDIGPIDNSPLLDASGRLRQGMQIDVDLQCVPSKAYSMLLQWYGTKGVALSREVAAPGGIGSESVEFYPPTFTVVLLSHPPTSCNLSSCPTTTFEASIGRTVGELQTLIKNSLSISETSTIRLWRLPEQLDQTRTLKSQLEEVGIDHTKDLNEALLSDAQVALLVELQLEGAIWALDAATSTSDESPVFGQQTWLDKMEEQNHVNFLNPRYTPAAASAPALKSLPNGNVITSTSAPNKLKPQGIVARLKSHTRLGAMGGTSGKTPGLVGLQNLGNTCFMASSLQCMSNCPELKTYFLSSVYKSELNPTNPLGMGGKVADAFGQLIERLWDPRVVSSSVAPREFKAVIGRFASQFLGYGQQDSQELLAFLLDALHEDLNRVKQKPFDEIPDWEGGGDQELVEFGEKCWELYKRRNDSVIVDLFQGQYKSTLVCPVCQKVAIKFDPVQYLTLQLGSNLKYHGTFLWVPLPPSSPCVSVTFEVPTSSSLRDTKRHLGKILSADPDRMAVFEDFKGKPWKLWQDHETIDTIAATDIITVYETPEPFAAMSKTIYFGDGGYIIIPVIHALPPGSSFIGRKQAEHVGRSFILVLTQEEASSVESINEALMMQYARRSKRAEEMWIDPNTVTEVDESTSPTLATDSASTVDKMDTSPADSQAVQLSPANQLSSPSPEGGINSLVDTKMGSMSPISTTSVSRATARDIKISRPKAGLFKVQVPERRSGRLPSSQDMNGQRVLLTDRALSVQQLNSPVASSSAVQLPSPFETNNDDDALYGPDTATTSVATPTVEPAPSSPTKEIVPLLGSGDYIECEWKRDAWQEYMGEAGDSASGYLEPETCDDPEMVARSQIRSNSSKKAIHLEDCLKELRTPEELGEDDMWRCPVCKEFRQATKTMQIWKAPDILVVHLKRFSSARTSFGRSSKIDSFVDFPIEGLDLSDEVEGVKVASRLKRKRREDSSVKKSAVGEVNQPILEVDTNDDGEGGDEEESLVYDLFAVSNHFGGLGGGHYTAFAKNESDGRWHNFDDTHVSIVSDPEKVKTSAAYLLFYRRRTSKVLGAKTHDIVTSAMQSRNASAAPSERGDRSDEAEADADAEGEIDSDVAISPVARVPRLGRSDDEDFKGRVVESFPTSAFTFGAGSGIQPVNGPIWGFKSFAKGSDGSVSPPSSGGRASPSSGGRRSPDLGVPGWTHDDDRPESPSRPPPDYEA